MLPLYSSTCFGDTANLEFENIWHVHFDPEYLEQKVGTALL